MSKKGLFEDPVVRYTALGIGVIVVGKFFGAFDKLLQALGLQDSQDTTDLDSEAGSGLSFWSPNFWKSAPQGSLILTNAAAQADAKAIYNATGFFDDSEDNIKAVFRGLKTQSQASYLADTFQQVYKADLLAWLRGGIWPADRLSDSDVNEINKFIKSLPKYKV